MENDSDLFDINNDYKVLDTSIDGDDGDADYFPPLERIMKKLNRINEKLDFLLDDNGDY